MEKQEFTHVPVLLHECIEGLQIKPNGIYVDGTLGRAGHSLEIARRLTTGRLICIDRDDAALEAARLRLADFLDRVTLVHSNFSAVADVLAQQGIGGADGMLFDLGVSSPQLDDAQRGFSYMHDAPLDMRMDRSAALTARTVVNDWPAEELRRILFEYGEERYAPRHCPGHREGPGGSPHRNDAAAGRDHPLCPAGGSPAGETAPRQTELPGHPHRRERRAGRPAADDARRRPLFEPRRADLRDHVPFLGGPPDQARHAGPGQGLHLPAGFSGVRVRPQAHGLPGHPQADPARPAGIGREPPRPQRKAAHSRANRI